MEIKNIPASTVSATALTGTKDLAALLPQLQLGNSLGAVVTAKLAENSFLLTLSSGQTLRAQTPTVLELGQTLKLEVAKVGAIPELKIISPELGMQPETAAVLQALRQFLPKQENLTDFAVTLRQMANLTSGKTDTVSTVINQVLGALPAKDDLVSVEGLKQGVSNSGVFLEAKLANQLPPQGDLKGHLLTLANALQNIQVEQNDKGSVPNTAMAPTVELKQVTNSAGQSERLPEALSQTIEKDNTLLNKTEGAIARIVVDQLASLPKNGEQQNFWQIQIPYIHGQHTDTVQLAISRENKSNTNSEKANWSVELELNPPGLGKLHSRISLVDDRIDTYFWSQQQALTALVQDNLTHLADSYTQAGLAVGKLNALEGAATHTKTSDISALPSLLDERI
ncbi:putative flagellar hook-length control protein [Methyloglobulus morosus KoM1]|uniref:Putative flagellar hook-length control protein n=1 Tax=Methyloglobulus morosus KoM1 TaxID=1116472 RepID=V5C0G1_9GAMM|nr:flagellar hook-length control protein FliK [Methyloglobulus morosus]ESS70288.1 putative flagellar hook-length control protein [Methyloglobulus morosus KoM1]